MPKISTLMKVNFTIIFLICFAFSSFAQDKNNQKLTINKKKYEVIKVSSIPIIDGELNDEVWLRTPNEMTDFIQNQPQIGAPSKYKTVVKMVYDNEAVYIGAMMYDENPDSILKQLTIRDDIGNSDWFAVMFDTYEDGNNGFGFVVTAAGVQVDTKYFSNGEDVGWNAIWDSEVSIVENGWIVEIKLPLSALRFPDKSEQVWNFNATRTVRRSRERSWWNNLKPEVDGFFNQAGKLVGIKDIESPIRLFLNPYVSTNFENNSADNSWSRGFNVGMDIKYGINDAYTLDMTLVPDFGQVVTDDVVLNLSPFEVFFDENRQFFTEGTELFQKAGLFYSRRIGGTPSGFHSVLNDTNLVVIDNPGDIQLINSTKVSGRGKNGLGVGVLNSVTNSAYATVENKLDSTNGSYQIQTEPLTNYNVIALDQIFKNNSYLSFVNTNVYRDGSAYEANVTGTEFRFADKTNTYSVSGDFSLSQKYFEGFNNPELGTRYSVSFGKNSGNIQYGANHFLISKQYDNNDLGFETQQDIMQNYAFVGYQRFKAFGPFLRARVFLNGNIRHQVSTRQFANFNMNLNYFMMTKEFFAFGGGFGISPLINYDLFETRTGRILAIPENRETWAWFSSDYRKPFALDMNIYYNTYNQEKRNNIGIRIQPIIRINDKLSFNTTTNIDKSNNYIGWVANVNSEPIVGRRDFLSVENVISSSYIFNNKMGLTFRLRHNWSEAIHDNFYLVNDENGEINLYDWDKINDEGNTVNVDRNFNFLSVDMVYSWQFAPGSFLTANWKNNIYSFNDIPIDETYFFNLKNTITNDQTNLFSIKVIYFLDYLNVQKRFK